MDKERTITRDRKFCPPERFLNLVQSFEDSSFIVQKDVQNQISYLCDVSRDVRDQNSQCTEKGFLQTLDESICGWPQEDLNLLKSILLSYDKIPSEFYDNELHEATRKELEGLFTRNNSEPSESFLMTLRSETFRKCIMSWFERITNKPIPIFRRSTKTSRLSKPYDGQPDHVKCKESMEGTAFLANWMWSKEPFVGKVRVSSRVVDGQGQKIRIFFPGNPGANMRMKKSFDELKNQMLQHQRDHFKNNSKATIEWLQNLIDEEEQVTCTDLTNFSANFPRKQLEAIVNKILDLASEFGSPDVTLQGCNNQVEVQTLIEYLEKCFDCILNTEIEDLGFILNGTTLGIIGGWLLCTLAHILILISEGIQKFLVKGDDVVSNGSMIESLVAQKHQVISDQKSIFESRTNATFLKMQFEFEDITEDLDQESIESRSSCPGRNIRLANKVPFARISSCEPTKLRSKISTMIDLLNNPGEMSQDLQIFQRDWTLYLASSVSQGDFHYFETLVSQSIQGRIPLHSQGVQKLRFKLFGDFKLRIPTKVDDVNWVECADNLHYLLQIGIRGGICLQDDRLNILALDGKIHFVPDTKMVEARDLFQDSQDLTEAVRLGQMVGINNLLHAKWIQKGSMVLKVTVGDFQFVGTGVKKQETLRV